MRNIFDEINDGQMGEDDFNEWLAEYTEEILKTAKVSSEVDLTSLKEWVSAEYRWEEDEFESGYDTAREDVRDMLGLKHEN